MQEPIMHKTLKKKRVWSEVCDRGCFLGVSRAFIHVQSCRYTHAVSDHVLPY